MDEDLWGHGRAPPKPDVPRPSHDDGVASKRQASKGEAQENEPPSQEESPQDQHPSEPDPEEIAEMKVILPSRSLTVPLHQEVDWPKAESDT